MNTPELDPHESREATRTGHAQTSSSGSHTCVAVGTHRVPPRRAEQRREPGLKRWGGRFSPPQRRGLATYYEGKRAMLGTAPD